MTRRTDRLHTLRPAALAALLLAAVAAPAEAQSLFANRGLGLLTEPQDGRSAGLGGVRLGLPAAGLSWANPASAAGIPAPGFLGSLQYDDFSAAYDERTSAGTTARFPLLLAAFPYGRWALSVGYGSYLDQNWSIEQVDTLRLEQDTVQVVDRFRSEGGVARLRGGVAYQIVEGLSVGLALDTYTGSAARTNGRLFPGEGEPSCCSATWHYGGFGYLLGARWAPSEALSLGVALHEGGTLEADPRTEGAEEASYDLPLTLRAGATGRVAGNLLVALGAERAGWSSLDEAVAEQGGARDTWSWHGGVEYDGLVIRDRPVPLRLGARRADLPFGWGTPEAPAEFATEQAWTGGLGVILAGGATRTDLGFESGTRGGDGAGIEESYWRLHFSVQVLGL